MSRHAFDHRESGSGSIVGGLLGLAAVIIVATGVFMWLFSAAPDAGEEAVLIQKPIFFGHGGVVAEPVKTGRQTVWPTTQVVYVDTKPQQFTAQFDDLMSSDGVPLDFDAIIRLRVTDSVGLVSVFGPDWYHRNVEREFMNRVRQAVRKHGMNDTAINTTAVEAIDKEVSAAMTSYLADAKLPVELVQVTVGKANPPDAVKTQRIETARQQQRQITENERKIAEDARLAAETSRAAADEAYRKAMSLSPDQFVSLQEIGMQREVCLAGHCTMIVGGGGATPLIQLPGKRDPIKIEFPEGLIKKVEAEEAKK